MTEENRTERIAMMWTKTLKEAVRSAAGHGGMTDFVIEAVEAKLAGFEPDLGPEQPSDEEERVLVEAAASPTVIKTRERREVPVAPPVEPEPEAYMEPMIDQTRDDLFARVMAKAGNAEELEKNKAKFSTASDLPKPVRGMHAVRIDDCPKCGDEMIDGECWSCS